MGMYSLGAQRQAPSLRLLTRCPAERLFPAPIGIRCLIHCHYLHSSAIGTKKTTHKYAFCVFWKQKIQNDAFCPYASDAVKHPGVISCPVAFLLHRVIASFVGSIGNFAPLRSPQKHLCCVSRVSVMLLDAMSPFSNRTCALCRQSFCCWPLSMRPRQHDGFVLIGLAGCMDVVKFLLVLTLLVCSWNATSQSIFIAYIDAYVQVAHCTRCLPAPHNGVPIPKFTLLAIDQGSSAVQGCLLVRSSHTMFTGVSPDLSYRDCAFHHFQIVLVYSSLLWHKMPVYHCAARNNTGQAIYNCAAPAQENLALIIKCKFCSRDRQGLTVGTS